MNLCPPLRELGVGVTALCTQDQEIVRRAKQPVLHQPAGAGAPPVFETPLHEQHFLHRRAESPRQRGVLLLFCERFVTGIQKGLDLAAAVLRANPVGGLRMGNHNSTA